MFNIHLVNQNVTILAEDGELLSQACADAGFPLDLVCGGKGKCGKCKVDIARMGRKESVLACIFKVDSDMEVWLKEEQLSRTGSILTEGQSAHERRLDPALTRTCYTRQQLTPDHCGAALKDVSLEVARRYSRLTAMGTEQITFTRYRDTVLSVDGGDLTRPCYGAAVDIGTTTVVLYAYDLTTGELLHTESLLNSQIARGADVISRILHTIQDPDGLEELNGLIRECINKLISAVERRVPGFSRDLWHMVLCGNSTMQHLFLSLHPHGLSVDPFYTVTADIVRCSGQEAGLNMAPRGVVEFLPLLGGFVGADTASVLLTLPEESRGSLMIDLGTNGEIAVGCGNGEYKVASTACGPALEGGNIECGMRGTDGAIEKISLADDKVAIKVIGNIPPKGLCGSAIIDAVAELRRTGIVDDTGRMLTREEYEAEHPGSALAQYMEEVGEYNPAFIFYRGEKDVYISQKDVRQIQLAKSSIHSGCVALLAEEGLEPQDVNALYLAGAFGNYIDVDNALAIGLLPAVPRERIHSIGNGAGLGVRMCLLDKAHLDRAAALPDKTEHLELATSPRFMEEYILNMNF